MLDPAPLVTVTLSRDMAEEIVAALLDRAYRYGGVETAHGRELLALARDVSEQAEGQEPRLLGQFQSLLGKLLRRDERRLSEKPTRRVADVSGVKRTPPPSGEKTEVFDWRPGGGGEERMNQRRERREGA